MKLIFRLFLLGVVSCSQSNLPCSKESIGKKISWVSGSNSCEGTLSRIQKDTATVSSRVGVAVFACHNGLVNEKPMMEHCKKPCSGIPEYVWGNGADKCRVPVQALPHNGIQFLKMNKKNGPVVGHVFLLCVNGVWIEDAEKTSCGKM